MEIARLKGSKTLKIEYIEAAVKHLDLHKSLSDEERADIERADEEIPEDDKTWFLQKAELTNNDIYMFYREHYKQSLEEEDQN